MVFNENKLQEEIIKTWGKDGAHNEVFNIMLEKIKEIEQCNIPVVSNQRELLLEEMDKYLMLNTSLDVRDLVEFKDRFKQ